MWTLCSLNEILVQSYPNASESLQRNCRFPALSCTYPAIINSLHLRRDSDHLRARNTEFLRLLFWVIDLLRGNCFKPGCGRE